MDRPGRYVGFCCIGFQCPPEQLAFFLSKGVRRDRPAGLALASIYPAPIASFAELAGDPRPDVREVAAYSLGRVAALSTLITLFADEQVRFVVTRDGKDVSSQCTAVVQTEEEEIVGV